MMSAEATMLLFFGAIGASIAACGIMRDQRRIFAMPVVASVIATLFSTALGSRFFTTGVFTAFAENILVDEIGRAHV